MFYMQIPISAAVLYLGRKPDGYGGRAALSRILEVSQQALNRWAGPNLPLHHAKTLVEHDRRCRKLDITPRRNRRTKKNARKTNPRTRAR